MSFLGVACLETKEEPLIVGSWMSETGVLMVFLFYLGVEMVSTAPMGHLR